MSSYLRIVYFRRVEFALLCATLLAISVPRIGDDCMRGWNGVEERLHETNERRSSRT